MMSVKSTIKERDSHFNGIIQGISYTIKETPHITVNGNSYYLSTNWKFNEKMSVGDSIIKEEGSNKYKLIKIHSGKIFFSN
jgi:hypothetical protein